MLAVHEFDDGKGFGIADEIHILSFVKRGELAFIRRADCERAIETLHEAGLMTLLDVCAVKPTRRLEEMLFRDMAW